MAVSAGTRLGPYEILSALGAGGMGEVYKARDTRLDRTVAIKILPEALAADPQFRERFNREARAISQLTHPHICTLHDVGEQNGTSYLVMEYLDGETLATRLQKGALPLPLALTVAIEVADALDWAHRAGITHRDLKPGNVMLTKSGAKLMDFGLAKTTPRPTGVVQAFRPAVPGGPEGPHYDYGESNLPTMPPNLTAQGTILGTLQYMAPEQLEGREADARTDIFAFGVVLYEMVTGKKAFEGQTQASVIAAIIGTDPPPISTIQPLAPPALDRVVKTCLTKDPDDRWQTARDLLRELKWTAEGDNGSSTAVAPTAKRRAYAITATSIALGMIAAALVTWSLTRPGPAPPPRVTRMTIAPTGTTALTISGVGGTRGLALTPDGSRVVYVGNQSTQLFVRALDALEPVVIATGAPSSPFVSPDGQWVGFGDSGGTLKKVALTGGPPVTITRLDGVLYGATWAPDDTILFATHNTTTGLQRVAAAGGAPTVLTRPDRARGEADHLWPEILPGGGAVLFTITAQTGGLDAAQVAVRDLRTGGTQKILVRGGSDAQYIPSGHLVYTAAGTLRAVAFDMGRLEVRGSPVSVVPRLVVTFVGAGLFAAADGTLVYVDWPGGVAPDARTLVWVDRTGREQPIVAPPRDYRGPRISPDGTRLALHIVGQEHDVWIWDLRRETLTQLTFEPGVDWYPQWTPDGRRLVFASDRGGVPNLWWQAADGTGAAERLTESSNQQPPTDISPDGTAVVFYEQTPAMGRDVMRLSLVEPRRVTPLVQTKFDERNGIVSPNGRWLAYESDRSGRLEIYVSAFAPAASGQWLVSTGGGVQPLWAPSGTELFYLAPDGALMRVAVEASGAAWRAGTPAKLLEGRYLRGVLRNYDVSPDGQRFLRIAEPALTTAAPPIIVVQHWGEELKRLVPTK